MLSTWCCRPYIFPGETPVQTLGSLSSWAVPAAELWELSVCSGQQRFISCVLREHFLRPVAVLFS